jgi:hypothetical protein
VGVDIWQQTVTLRDQDGERRTLPLEALRAEVSQGFGKPKDRGPNTPPESR